MRTLQLSPNLIDDIHTTCEHFINNQDRSLSQDYEELRDMASCDTNRFKLTVTLEERIPQCSDIIVNILVKHILEIVDCNESDLEEMAAFYVYLEEVHDMDYQTFESIKKIDSTPIELEHCVKWLINSLGGDA